MTSNSIQFEAFTLNMARLSLHGPAGQVDLRPKSFEVLRYLAEHAGRIVTKTELMQAVWPDVIVTDESLTRCVSDVRHAIGDNSQRIIKTVPRRGYLFDVATSSDGIPETGTHRKESEARPGASQSAPTASWRRDTPSLAVKPFDDLDPDPADSHLAEGLTNGILAALTRVPKLSLIEDESPSLAISRQMTVHDLGRRFDVRYVLKGSVRKCGEKVRVNAELLQTSDGRYLWAGQFDRDLHDHGDLLAIQDEITEQIVTAMDVKLLHGEAGRMVRNVLKNPAALESNYHGEEVLWHATTRLELHEAQRLFEETIRLEPKASVGYSEAALAYWLEAFLGLSGTPSRALDKAMKLARDALALKDVTGYPHLVMAHVHLIRREYDEALAEATRAVLARPSCPGSYSLKASVLCYLGRPTEAIEFAEYAVRLTPVWPPMFPAILASAYYGSGRYEEAVATAKATIDLDSQRVDPYLILAASDVVLGRAEEARWAAERIIKLRPAFKLQEYRASQPYKDPKQLDRLLSQLRDAGLT